jgi:hypothetical protein
VVTDEAIAPFASGMNLDQAVIWLAQIKNRVMKPETLQKTATARLEKLGIRRDKSGVYYPLG